MEKPLFYCESPETGILPESEAYHIHKVLRARPGDQILITDGKGVCLEVALTDISPKKASFVVQTKSITFPRPYRIRIAVAPTRKSERNEWMLEKLVEIGIDEIDFIKTTHTHHESFDRVVNQTRMERIAIAAMKQSRQFYLPQIRIGRHLSEVLTYNPSTSAFIAYVPEKSTAAHLVQAARSAKETLILIGPEGDFTPQEVSEAINAGFTLSSLGETRLRTETAAITACHAIHLANLS